jgi:RNA polymerase sigma factor (sigma-70 family)
MEESAECRPAGERMRRVTSSIRRWKEKAGSTRRGADSDEQTMADHATAVSDEAALVGDAELLAEFARSRSDAVFARIVERHGGMVQRACRRILGDPDAAEDAAQAVFLVLARRATAVRGEQLGAWLHGVAVRVSMRQRRDRSCRVRHERRAAQLAPSGSGEEREPELDARLDQALAQLPEPLRQAVVLCHLEGRTQQEAARIAGCAPGTLGWRSSEGIKRLRRLLGVATPVGAVALANLLTSEAQAPR